MFDLLKFKNNTAVITDRGEVLSYEELYAQASQFANAVTGQPLLFCLCENRIGSLVGYVGCLEHNIPIVLLDGGKDVASLKNLIDIYQPEYLWLLEDRIGDYEGERVYEYGSYVLLRMHYKSDVEKPSINQELALCLSTSGSTGSPKFVRLSLNNIKANAESIAEYLEIDENERPVTTLPSYYSYGVSVINSHLIKGATLLLTDGTMAQRHFWDFVKEQKEAGTIKHFGFSFHDTPELLDRVLTDHPEMEFVQLQINYLDWESPWIRLRECYEVATPDMIENSTIGPTLNLTRFRNMVPKGFMYSDARSA